MDLHGAELKAKKVMERVSRTLNLVRTSKSAQAETTHRQFQHRRGKRNVHDFADAHASDRVGKSVFDIQGVLLRLPLRSEEERSLARS